jgi:hypothetical protein
MDKQKLTQLLINNSTRLYAVLDGASVPELPMKLYDSGAPNVCLFSGDLEPDMLYVAPFVVYLAPNGTLTDWLFTNGFGKHFGIFLHSRRSMNEMRRHFRSLVNVYDESGKPLTFRFYDPRVIRKFLPTCTGDELKSFFGDVDSFFAESENGESLRQYQLANDALKETELS